jgi:AcrR family transcriptional regulator
MSAPTGGLRERKKVATRKALHEAAVRLAVEHGLERLTVEAIADAADVSRRTFSNYFANKEEALLWSDRVRMDHFLELVAARPGDESPWRAMSAAALDLVDGDAHDPRWSAQVQLLRRHPSLLAQQVARYSDVERSLAELVAARLSPGGRRLAARPPARGNTAHDVARRRPAVDRGPVVAAARRPQPCADAGGPGRSGRALALTGTMIGPVRMIGSVCMIGPVCMITGRG